MPFHQFLRVRKLQLQASEPNAHNAPVFVGEADPEEFVDPFLGTLMKDPVLLTTSNRVVDRSVAIQSIMRGGRDPFNGKRLSQSMIQAMPELAERIVEWKRKERSSRLLHLVATSETSN